MNVLLITFSFPPAGGVGVLRAVSLARYFPENGIRVDVLTARNAPAVGRDLSLLQQVPSSVTVHRTWTLDLPFALRKGVKRMLSRRRSNAQASPTDPPVSVPAPGLLQRGKHLVRDLVANLLLPDPQVGWLPFALPAARRIIRSRHIDLVLITVPPFSSVRLAAPLRRAFPTLPIIVDFRDEWVTTTLSLVSYNKSERARRVALETEAAAVQAATAIVTVTHAAAAELRRRYPQQPENKFECIPNGFEGTVAEPGEPADGDRVVFTYIGSIYGSTDPRSVLQAVSELPPELRAQLRLRFIGHIETEAYRAALAALGDTVETIGFLPQAKALQQLRQSNYALLITHDPINVSAKFYDYIGGGVPIVAAVHPAGEVRRLLEETQAGWWADVNDPAAIQSTLIEAISRTRRNEAFRPNREIISQYRRQPLAARYARLLDRISTDQKSRDQKSRVRS